MRRKNSYLIGFMIFCVILLGIKKYLPNMSYKKFYFGENIFAVIEDKYDFKYKLKKIDGRIYIPFGLVKKYIDSYIFCDREKNKIIITDEKNVLRLELNSFEYKLNEREKKLKNKIKMVGEEFYLPDDFLIKKYNLGIDYKKRYKLVKIYFREKDYDLGEIKKNSFIRYAADKKSFKAQKVYIGEKVKIYGETGDYFKIQVEDGLLGYIEKKYIINKKRIAGEKKIISEKNSNKEKEKIKMAWDGIYNLTANYYAIRRGFNKNINLVSPTWFFFDREKLDGELKNFVSKEYVKKAHDNKIKVCPSLSDELDYELNHAIIIDSDKREYIIKQIIDFIDEYNLDGINIDFEGVKKNDANCYIEFLRELAPLLKKRDLILIVDVFVPEVWSRYYNREEIGKIADYVCVMAYDEFNRNSGEAGPVASYDFVLNGIKNMLKEVEREKIILGLPFYTRIWKLNKNRLEIENVGMQVGIDFFKKRDVLFKWLDDKKYFYCEYKFLDEDMIYKSWIEDEISIEGKLKLVKKFGLSGISGWRLGFEKDIIWDLISRYIN